MKHALKNAVCKICGEPAKMICILPRKEGFYCETHDPYKKGPNMKNWTIEEIAEANDAAGKFFFSPDTLEFFEDAVENWEAINHPSGRVFIVNEENPRLYGQIREFYPESGGIGLPLKSKEKAELELLIP